MAEFSFADSLLSLPALQPAKNPLHRPERKLGAPVLIPDSLVVHGPGPTAEPTVAHPAVAELPDIDAAYVLSGKHRRKLLLQRLFLIFLRPFHHVGGAVSVDCPCADLRNQEGLARPFRLLLHPAIEVVQIFPGRRVVVPEGKTFLRRQPPVHFRLS